MSLYRHFQGRHDRLALAGKAQMFLTSLMITVHLKCLSKRTNMCKPVNACTPEWNLAITNYTFASLAMVLQNVCCEKDQ